MYWPLFTCRWISQFAMSAALTVLTDSIVEINRRASGSKLAALSVCVVLGALAGCSGGGGGGGAPVGGWPRRLCARWRGGAYADTAVSLTVNQPPVTANACVTPPENTAVNGTLFATDESGSQPFTFSQRVAP